MVISKQLTTKKMEFTFEGIAGLFVAALIGSFVSYFALRNTKKAEKAEDEKLNKIQETLNSIDTRMQDFGQIIAVGEEKHKVTNKRLEAVETKVDKVVSDVMEALFEITKSNK